MATRVTVIKKNGKSLEQDIKEFILPISSQHLEVMGQLTEQAMKGHIRESLVRPGSTGNLENSVFAERISPLSVGVGNISHMDNTASHWRAINWGSSHMVGKQMPKGIFSPGNAKPDQGSFRDGRFYPGAKDGNKTYAPIVTKPILPHNYIERTQAQIPTLVERALQI